MYVDILILKQLQQGSKHGYEIKKSVEKMLGSRFSINNNMLYPAMRKFEEMGAVEKKIEIQEGKPSRHTYSLTELGLEILQEMLCEFPLEIAAVEAEFIVRVAFFDMLDPEARKNILKTRKIYLESGLEHLEEIIERELSGSQETFMGRVVNFRKLKIIQEQNWIAEIERECEE